MLNHHLNTAGRSEAWDWRRVEGNDIRPWDGGEFRPELGQDRIDPKVRGLSLRPVRHGGDHQRSVGRSCPVQDGIAVDDDDVFDARCLGGKLHDPLRDTFGPLQRGTVRQLHVNHQITLVFRWQEALRQRPSKRHDDGNGTANNDNADDRNTNQPPHNRRVAISNARDAPVEQPHDALGGPERALRIRPQSAGDRVRALMEEITTETEMVTANWE